MISKEEAVGLLIRYAPDNDTFNIVYTHSKKVAEIAVRLAKQAKANGKKIDVDFVEVAALLHDIGRFRFGPNDRSQIQHGIKGAELMKEEGESRIARVCETHVGIGITKADIKKQTLDLPEKDYIPKTPEEKIICYADKLTETRKGKPVEVTFEEIIKRYKKEIGEFIVPRMEAFQKEIDTLIN